MVIDIDKNTHLESNGPTYLHWAIHSKRQVPRIVTVFVHASGNETSLFNYTCNLGFPETPTQVWNLKLVFRTKQGGKDLCFFG
jgi:hypothetical protein